MLSNNQDQSFMVHPIIE